MRKTLMVAVGVGAALALALMMGSADAGIRTSGDLAVTPNPATAGQTVTISNASGAANTCENPASDVTVSVHDATTDDVVFSGSASPDGTGNWQVTIDAGLPAGSYNVFAHCPSPQMAATASAGAATPAATGTFEYNTTVLVVNPAPTPTPTPAVQPAAAVAVTPSFTG